MASSPATAMAGPVPAPVEASGAAPAAWPSSAVPAGFGEAAGFDVSGVLPGSPWPSPPALLPPVCVQLVVAGLVTMIFRV